uniref:Acidic repeat-containing protein-like isoform X2 n=1 Tax=Phascolarctos cinereus TaxID=38626 RepID=A0A6P5LKZ9_PHACI|nr:acidic repeat-containing protein-like isoform X2 [Phascolarctos cinereus]
MKGKMSEYSTHSDNGGSHLLNVKLAWQEIPGRKHIKGQHQSIFSIPAQSRDCSWSSVPPTPEASSKDIKGHFEYLEDALMCPDLPPAYQTDDSKDKSSDDSDGDNSDDSTENHDSSSDHSDNHSHDGHANDVYSNGCVKLHQQGMHTVGSHLHNMQTELEQSCTNAVERSGRAVEPEEEEEEVHKENEASQQTEQEAPPSGSTLDDGGTMSASSDLESCESEGSPDEELLVPSLPPSFIPGQLGDFEDDLLYPRLPPVSQIPSNSESELARWEKTEQQPSFSSSCDLCLCRLI